MSIVYKNTKKTNKPKNKSGNSELCKRAHKDKTNANNLSTEERSNTRRLKWNVRWTAHQKGKTMWHRRKEKQRLNKRGTGRQLNTGGTN